MPGYDDPRFVQQQIETLQRDLKALKAATLPLQANQKGPIPGWLRAVVIEASRIVGTGFGTPGAAGMSIDLTGNTPGQSPLIRINDGTRDRVLVGNCAAYTDPGGLTSPAQEGLQIIDTNGFLVMDAIGHAGIMTPLAQQSSGVLNQVINGPVTASAINSSSATFTLFRTLRVMTFYSAIFSVPSGGTGFAYVNARMDASDSGGNNHHFMLNVVPSGSTNTPFVMGFHVRVDTLAGSSGGTSHTADITCDVDASTSIQVYKTGLYVFQLGA